MNAPRRSRRRGVAIEAILAVGVLVAVLAAACDAATPSASRAVTPTLGAASAGKGKSQAVLATGGSSAGGGRGGHGGKHH